MAIQESPQIDDAKRCQSCGGQLSSSGLCSTCLLQLAATCGPDEDVPLFETLQGQGFGDYEVTEEIARGGMGVVYRAKQRSLNREVALKMILAGELASEKSLRMFQTEARAAANLHHPNIVPVYEIGEDEMQHYFTMRYVPGGMTIATWAKQQGRDPKAMAAAAAKVARAVAHAHERGVLHRDIKPSNVLWDPAGEPMVTDFGLAKLQDENDLGQTRAGDILGSPCYMAPEQFDPSRTSITTLTDVYGIGALLFEMLSGYPPFTGSSILETMRKVAEVPPRLPTHLPRDIRVICLKCLAKRSGDRYPSASALADDLERFARGLPVSAAPLTAPQALWRWAQRHPGSAALASACLISIILGVGGIFWQWRAAERANAAQAQALESLRWREVERWVNSGDASRAVGYLASVIRKQPSDWRPAMYAMSIIDHHSFPVLVGPEVEPPSTSTCRACLSPDGSWFATAGQDQVVRVWDVVTGMQRHTLPQSHPISSLAPSVGEIKLAVATRQGVLVYMEWDDTPVSIACDPIDPPKELAFSADGKWLSARCNQRILVWRTAELTTPPATFPVQEAALGFSWAYQGGRVLVWTASKAMVWNADDQSQLMAIKSRFKIRSGCISANGARFTVVDGEFSIRTWDIDSGREFPVVESPLSAMRLASLNADGTRVTIGGNNNSLVVHDVESTLRVSGPMEHHYNVENLISNAKSERVYSYGSDGYIKCWDASSGVSVQTPIAISGLRNKTDLSCSADGLTLLAHAREEKRLKERISVWRGTATLKPKKQIVEGQRDSNSGSLSPDGRYGCIGLYPGRRAYVYELDTGKVMLDEAVKGDVYVHLFSPNSRRCYALTANGWVYGWSLNSGQMLWPPIQQPGNIRPGMISPDGKRILAGHNDGHIRIYDTVQGKLVKTLDHPGEVKTLRWAPDRSGRFVSGSTDTLAHLWDLNTGVKIRTFAGHAHTIIASAWSPDSNYMATASYDFTVRIWETNTGRLACPPLPHLSWLSHVEFSPDGRLIATACRDGTTRLWNARTGEPISPPLQQGTTCETVHFTRDGLALMVRDHSGFRFWDTDKAEPVSIHYQEPVSSGMGMDSESQRSNMTPDGSNVFLSGSMNYGSHWTVAQPRGPSPPWFAEFLETLATVRQDGFNHTTRIPAGQMLRLRELIRTSTDQGVHGSWARRILGLGEGE